LRIYVPNGFNAKSVVLTDGLTAAMQTDKNLLTIDSNRLPATMLARRYFSDLANISTLLQSGATSE
jgi:hypothetical protein